MAISREALLGRWAHSHEEDDAAGKVFRREGFAFPPSRGREAFELKPDGTCLLGQPGPADVPEGQPGTWKLDGTTLRLEWGEGAGGAARSLEIVAVEPDRLLVRE